jgi:pimeloyl-ACP methyl ester carboxylesterase
VTGRAVRPRPNVIALRDDRRLAWYEFGDPDGVPCVYMPGTPESGLAGGCYDRAAREAGVRWISVDKPGYGHSDPKPRRRLVDWPADVSELTDHLGLGSFAVVGESGGGPHALAVAHANPVDTHVVVLLGSAGLGGDTSVPPGMTLLNTLLFRCMQITPGLVRAPLAVMSYLVRHEGTFPRIMGLLGRGVPEVDRVAMSDPEYDVRFGAGYGAFRQGSRAAADELVMLRGSWGFAVSEVRVPVHMWHGKLDANVPFSMAQGLSRELPQVTTHFYDDAAHAVGFQHREAVMDVVATRKSPVDGGP